MYFVNTFGVCVKQYSQKSKVLFFCSVALYIKWKPLKCYFHYIYSRISFLHVVVILSPMKRFRTVDHFTLTLVVEAVCTPAGLLKEQHTPHHQSCSKKGCT